MSTLSLSQEGTNVVNLSFAISFPTEPAALTNCMLCMVVIKSVSNKVD